MKDADSSFVHDNAALILAAGRGTRAAAGTPETPKQYRPVAGVPLFCHSLRAFLAHAGIQRVLVVIGAGERPLYDSALRQAGIGEQAKLLPPACGGASRQESVCAGLEALADCPPQNILVHDGARPMVCQGDISACIEALQNADAVAPALPLDDALKQLDETASLQHAPREEYRLAQTPQGFAYAALLQAHRQLAGSSLPDGSLPDDAAVMQQAGVPARAIAGRRENFKLTHAADFTRAEAVLGSDCRPLARIGWGFDVHRLVAGKPLLLCGIDIPYTHGLEGHSDADVGLHALADAILGAIAAGDIGEHFPPTDERWRNADSRIFLAHAAELARKAGFAVEQADITLICESPKIAPHRLAMRHAVADILGLPLEQVSIKATTTEGLGFLGRKEAIAAQAAAGLSHAGSR